MFDTLIRGGTVIDGTGRPAFAADVAVSGGRIAAIGDLSAASAAHVIDAAGRTVTPGFIDIHRHADAARCSARASARRSCVRALPPSSTATAASAPPPSAPPMATPSGTTCAPSPALSRRSW